MNPLKNISQEDLNKYAGKVVGISCETGEIIASASEKRRLKYPKGTSIYTLEIPKLNKPNLINRIGILLDCSGSMFEIRKAVVQTYNSIIQSIKENAESSNQETTISFIKFATFPTLVYFNSDVEKLTPLTVSTYNPSGQTALWDSIGEITNKFKDLNDNENVSYLIYVVTDGENNNSKKYDSYAIKKLIEDLCSSNVYTFTLQIPKGSKIRFCSETGIPTDNVREWEATEAGIEDVRVSTQAAMGNYYAARSVGVKAVTNFYVNTDLSKLSEKDLNKLKDISKQVKIYTIKDETNIKSFSASKTKKPLVIGQAYYLLFKKETIQKDKEIAILDKKTKKVYGGVEARKLIGLPENAQAIVNPFNHSSYEIFCQSCSVNRKLPSATRVLLDLAMVTPKTPTWTENN